MSSTMLARDIEALVQQGWPVRELLVRAGALIARPKLLIVSGGFR